MKNGVKNIQTVDYNGAHTLYKSLDELSLLAYFGAYGDHMFALRVWVGRGASKTFILVYFANDFIRSYLT